MRHRNAGRKLGRTTPHRLAMFRNQLASLVLQERIVTTISKAKELRPLAERVITQSKRGTVHARRLVGRWLLNRDHIAKLFDEIAPRFSTRQGGYLRIVKLGARQGDGAEMAILEFVDFQLKKKEVAPPSDAKAKKAKAADDEAEGAEEKAAKPKKEKAAKAPSDKKGGGKSGPKAKTTKSPIVAKKTSAPKKVGGG
jgi:large subunit ribosomal protein L17